jgi:Zn-dependent peptidase ImmA (M78 family)
LARLAPDRLEDLEHERAEFSWHDLDTCARVFGLRVDDLLAGEAGRAPMTLLLRSDQDESGLAIRDNLTAESCELLGEFQRVLRDIAELERELGRERPALPPIEDPAKPNLHPGERRARAVRMALGLGEEPIASMIELLDKLGISILWSSTAERALDGACARAPIAAVLVVLDEGPPTPWRTRATLAHELCHLLFDLHPERPVLLSPSAVRGPFLSSLERTARAFAASLLAPVLGVRRLVGSVDPTSEVAIAIVGSTFGVGRTLAINRLQHTFSLTDDKRLAMEHRMGANEALTYAANFTGDRPPERFGLRGEPLFGLVRQALQHGRIPPSRARRLLGISPLDHLPFEGLDPELCKPAVSPRDYALRSAFTYLVERHPGFVAREVEPLANGGWRVGVHDDRGERGSLLIGPAGSVEKDDTSGEAGTEG